MLQNFLDKLFVLFQSLLPERLLGRAVQALTRSRIPWVRDLLIRGFIRVFNVDLSEVEHPEPAAWEHMNAFFVRPLRVGARPLATAPDAFLSPCDGTLESLDRIDSDHLVQAKRFRYRLGDFLVMEPGDAGRFLGGATATIYLAPRDYHRVHMPRAGCIREMVYVPGRRWAVNRRTTRTVPGLFAANERVILWCDSDVGQFAVVLVGALNVASISLAWSGTVEPGEHVVRTLYAADDQRLRIPAGGLLGQFNLGSTVVIVAGPGSVTWEPGLETGTGIRMGQRLGTSLPGRESGPP